MRKTLLIRLLILVAALSVGSSSQAQDLSAILDECRDFLAVDQYQEGMECLAPVVDQLEIPSSYLKMENLPSNDLETQRTIIYRALSREFLGDFIGAQGDYHTFLNMTQNQGLATAVEARLRHIHIQTTEELGLLPESELDTLDYVYDMDYSGGKVAILPFSNRSEMEVLGPIGFAIAGFLSEAIDVLNQHIDRPISTIEHSHLRSGMIVVDTENFWATGNPITPPIFGKILGAEYVVTGTVNEVLGSLVARFELSKASNGTFFEGTGIESTVTSEGIFNLQRTLAKQVSNEIQELMGFEFITSEEDYLLGLTDILTSDVNAFLQYGYGFQQLVESDYSEAERIFNNNQLALAAKDLAVVDDSRRAIIQTFDGLSEITARSAFDNSISDEPEPTDAVILEPITQEVDEEPVDENTPNETNTDPDRGEEFVMESMDSSNTSTEYYQQTLPLLFDLSLKSLGQSYISNPTVGFRGPSLFGGGQIGDPRNGTSGLLDPTQSASSGGVTIIVPLPTGSSN